MTGSDPVSVADRSAFFHLMVAGLALPPAAVVLVEMSRVTSLREQRTKGR